MRKLKKTTRQQKSTIAKQRKPNGTKEHKGKQKEAKENKR